MSAAARPQVSVQNVDKKEEKASTLLAIPAVLLAPIRPDIVHFVHTSMRKNRRQPYAVSDWAGHQHSAESWGTGRAVARIPRVAGSGTSRNAQGAFANSCRKGRMFAPTQIWRKWHRRINTNQKRFAVCSALAASAIPALVSARGHRIDTVPEVPLVLPNSVEACNKTKNALAILKAVGGDVDVTKAMNSRKLRAGAGKMRNRRHVARRGPLIVYNEDKGLTKAFRNLPGVELCSVERLNLLQLAPGGHLGRFVVWTQGAFARLDSIWGTLRRDSDQKKGYRVPANIMANSDITRIINSDEVQSKLRSATKIVLRARRKKNPLKNLGALVKLNPYAASVKRNAILAQRRAAARDTKVAKARAVPAAKKEATKKKAARLTKQRSANFKRITAE